MFSSNFTIFLNHCKHIPLANVPVEDDAIEGSLQSNYFRVESDNIYDKGVR